MFLSQAHTQQLFGTHRHFHKGETCLCYARTCVLDHASLVQGAPARARVVAAISPISGGGSSESASDDVEGAPGLRRVPLPPPSGTVYQEVWMYIQNMHAQTRLLVYGGMCCLVCACSRILCMHTAHNSVPAYTTGTQHVQNSMSLHTPRGRLWSWGKLLARSA